MSGFRAHIRAVLAGKRQEWAEEWDRIMMKPRLQKALTRLTILRADPDFCLFVLAEYRWRDIELPDLEERAGLLQAVKTIIGATGWWARMLRDTCWKEEWDRIRSLLQGAESRLAGC